MSWGIAILYPTRPVLALDAAVISSSSSPYLSLMRLRSSYIFSEESSSGTVTADPNERVERAIALSTSCSGMLSNPLLCREDASAAEDRPDAFDRADPDRESPNVEVELLVVSL